MTSDISPGMWSRRRLLQAGAASALLAGVGATAACSSSKSTSTKSGGTTLNVAFFGDQGSADKASKSAAAFQAAHPGVTVKFTGTTGTDWNDFFSKLLTQIAAGNAPDIASVATEGLQLFAAKGLAHPLDDYVKRDATELKSYFSDVHPSLVEAMMYQGHLFELPTDFNAGNMFYNAKLFSSVGVDRPADDWTRDDFHIIRVDKNSGRKDFASTIKAVWPVMKRHTDVRVHLHTTGGRTDNDALEINDMLTREETVHARFSLPGLHNSFTGWPEPDLVNLYNAADLFVSTSRGEGFGLTLAEASACGVPVIAQNVSAIPETVGPGAVLIEPLTTITTANGSDLWLADVAAFSDAIERLYQSRGARRELGEAGRAHVTTHTWDFATAKFDLFIRALAQGVTPELEAAGRPS